MKLEVRLDKARATGCFQKVSYEYISIAAERRTNKHMMSNQICMKQPKLLKYTDKCQTRQSSKTDS